MAEDEEVLVHADDIIEFETRVREVLEDISDHAKADAPVLQIKVVRYGAVPPSAAIQGDAGYDLQFVPENGQSRVVRPGEVEMLETGIAVAIPEGHAGFVLPRSGMASKRGLRPINTPGLIDSGYRGEVYVAMEAALDRQIVAAGERIAQLVIVPLSVPTIEIVDELDETERGDNGFGSTG